MNASVVILKERDGSVNEGYYARSKSTLSGKKTQAEVTPRVTMSSQYVLGEKCAE